MCVTNVNVFLQVSYYFQNIFKFMCNRKGTCRAKVTKYYSDGLSSMMTPPDHYCLMLIPSLFSSPIFWRKIALPWQRSCAFVICWTMPPTSLNVAIAYCSSLTSLFSFFLGSTWLLTPFILPCFISFWIKYQVLWLSGILFYPRIAVVFLSLILPNSNFAW